MALTRDEARLGTNVRMNSATSQSTSRYSKGLNKEGIISQVHNGEVVSVDWINGESPIQYYIKELDKSIGVYDIEDSLKRTKKNLDRLEIFYKQNNNRKQKNGKSKILKGKV